MNKNAVILFLTVLALFAARTVLAEEVILENTKAAFTFSIDGKLAELKSVKNKETGFTFNIGSGGFWTVTVRNKTTGAKTNLTYQKAESLNHTLQDLGTTQKLTLTWTNIDIDATEKLDKVEVTVSLKDGEKLSAWRIGVESSTDKYSVFEVIMPELN